MKPPGGKRPILQGLSFRLAAGSALGIIGPSGAGKSTLARTLVGVWPAASGTVRLDGAALDQWEGPDVIARNEVWARNAFRGLPLPRVDMPVSKVR